MLVVFIYQAALYDYRVKDMYDENVVAWRNMWHELMDLLVPGHSYYDALWFLRWLPESIMTSKRKARLLKAQLDARYRKLSLYVQDRLSKNSDTSSFHAGLLRRETEDKPEMTPFIRDVGFLYVYMEIMLTFQSGFIW